MKILQLLSGGMDSATMLYKLRADEHTVETISFNYGQRHNKELTAVKDIAKAAGVNYNIIDLTGISPFLKGSSQTDSVVKVPEGHYAEENMKLTVVPNRNMIMIAVAVAVAQGKNFEAVGYAAHGGDHAIYPDCRPEFVDQLREAIYRSGWDKIELLAPFLYSNKADLVRLGYSLGVPFELTWSCYMGNSKACGKCGTCVERLEAFALAGIKDPIEYEDRNSFKDIIASFKGV